MKIEIQLLNCILIAAFIFFSESAHAQWKSKASGFPQPQLGINELIAVNCDVAWAQSYDRNKPYQIPVQNFTRTIDGGNTWIAGTLEGYPEQFLVGMAPRSAEEAYFITADINFIGKILRTTDGGSTWTEQFVSADEYFWDNIYFFNDNDGVVIGTLTDNSASFAIFTTLDGGNTWSQVPQEDLASFDFNEVPYNWSMSAVGDTIWTVSTTARVWRSTDKGYHWDAYTTDDTVAVVSNIKMRDGRHGLWGLEDELYRTSDGGVTWIEIEPTGTWFTFDLAYVPGTSGTYVSTGGGKTYPFGDGAAHGLGSSYTLDEGDTWITLDINKDHLAVDFVNEYTGFSGAFNSGNKKTGIFNYEGAALGYDCGNNQTIICHDGEPICARHSEIKEHLEHGDHLGACGELQRLNENSSPANNWVAQVSPNPFSTSTTISFSLSESQSVSLKIFDLQGRLIRTLAQMAMSAGTHIITWDGQDESGCSVSDGIYLLHFESVGFSQSEKLIVAK